MNTLDLIELNALDKTKQVLVLSEINKQLENFTVEQRIDWGIKYLPKIFVISSSFGIQAAVSLHLITRKLPNIPVILIDTGYLFPETYRFIDQITDNFRLNLQVFRAIKSSAWQEARHGKLWEQGIQGIKRYNYMNKVEPMDRALNILKVSTWIVGLRRDQSDSRKNLPVLAIKRKVFKLLPIIDWNNYQIYKYIKDHGLKYHPLWDKGYVSVGDVHTTIPLTASIKEADTRFFGLQRECGIHDE